jgi:Outer membrane protein beta-barrel domain
VTPCTVRRRAPLARLLVLASLAVGAVAGTAAPAAAQVGFTPEKSPYRDLDYRQELTGFAGYYSASKDRAGVAPRSGPIVGARYEVRIGGPAQLYVRGARAFSERNVIDPTKPLATRSLGTQSTPIYLADLGISLNLTGQKSVHSFVPVLSGGFGVVSDFDSKRDVGGYDFGTSFAFSFGAGIRYAPGGRFQLRADVNDFIYQIQYPATYFVAASDQTSVLKASAGRSQYRHNAALTLGASYLFFR